MDLFKSDDLSSMNMYYLLVLKTNLFPQSCCQSRKYLGHTELKVTVSELLETYNLTAGIPGNLAPGPATIGISL